MKCPNCGLDKSLYTTICDCGFDFESEVLESLNKKRERTMKCPSCGLTNHPDAIKCETLCGHGSHSAGRWVAIGLLSFFLFPIGFFSLFLLLGRKNYKCLKCGTQFSA